MITQKFTFVLQMYQFTKIFQKWVGTQNVPWNVTFQMTQTLGMVSGPTHPAPLMKKKQQTWPKNALNNQK